MECVVDAFSNLLVSLTFAYLSILLQQLIPPHARAANLAAKQQLQAETNEKEAAGR
jgi:hypothetical protein